MVLRRGDAKVKRCEQNSIAVRMLRFHALECARPSACMLQELCVCRVVFGLSILLKRERRGNYLFFVGVFFKKSVKTAVPDEGKPAIA